MERHVEAVVTGIRSFDFVVVTPQLAGRIPTETADEHIRIIRVGPVKQPPEMDPHGLALEREWVARLARDLHVRRVLSKLEFDVLHIHRPPLIELAYLAAKWRNAGPSKVLAGWLNRMKTAYQLQVFTDHGLFVHPSTASSLDLRWFMDWVLLSYNHVICVDPSGFQRARSLQDSDPSRLGGALIHYIPQPVDTELFHPTPFPESRGLIVGYTGRWERDGMFLLEALAKTKVAGVRLLVSGGATPWDLSRYAQTLTRNGVRLAPNLTRQTDLAAFYQSIHILVDFYRGEGSGRSVLEAMASGRPVLRMRAPNTHPVVDGETGFLVDADVTSIARMLATLVGRKEELGRVGRKAREAVLREYRLDLTLGKIEAVYRACVAAR